MEEARDAINLQGAKEKMDLKGIVYTTWLLMGYEKGIYKYIRVCVLVSKNLKNCN